jgi:hypothetical protein
MMEGHSIFEDEVFGLSQVNLLLQTLLPDLEDELTEVLDLAWVRLALKHHLAAQRPVVPTLGVILLRRLTLGLLKGHVLLHRLIREVDHLGLLGLLVSGRRSLSELSQRRGRRRRICKMVILEPHRSWFLKLSLLAVRLVMND